MELARRAARTALRTLGLLDGVRRVRRRADDRRRDEFFQAFKEACGEGLRQPLYADGHPATRALVVSIGFVDGLKFELGLIKGLQMAGLRPVVLVQRDPEVLRYYQLLDDVEIIHWDDFLREEAPDRVDEVLARTRTLDDLLRFQWHDMRVGRFVAATSFRGLRLGSLDLGAGRQREHVRGQLAEGLAAANAAVAVLDRVKPDLALIVDRGYTPLGQIFDRCLALGIGAVTWNAAHKSNTLMLKRYNTANRDDHHTSLSAESWKRVLAMPWTPVNSKRVHEELQRTYGSGDWFSEVGTQFNTQMLEIADLRRRLALDPSKKTAVIFPHIVWDGTFFWGTDLFRNYEEWLVETVRATRANPRVNWIIKFHPANLVKNARDGVKGEPSEAIALRRHLGGLPPEMKVIPAESDISTFSLFGLMDACLTVRGTIGIEAAAFGIPVLTAGTGRYDHKGFTIDSESREAYLERIARIHEIPRLTPEERERAERFAYSILFLRPLPLSTVTLEYRKDKRASLVTEIRPRTREDWLGSPDIGAFSRWVAQPAEVDFLLPSSGDGSHVRGR